MPPINPVLRLDAALRAPPEPGRLSARLFDHGTMQVRFYAPLPGGDLQVPHDQDEIYVVVAGEGKFEVEGTAHPCGPGDLLFVAANAQHRFLDYSADFAVWVVFYGPKGGEGRP